MLLAVAKAPGRSGQPDGPVVRVLQNRHAVVRTAASLIVQFNTQSFPSEAENAS
jgi:hypothetical protein